MEDNELKSIWNKADSMIDTTNDIKRFHQISVQKSTSVIDKFKRVIWGESIAGLAIFIWFGYFLFIDNDWVTFGALVLMALFQFYYFSYNILKKISALNYNQPLGNYLKQARAVIGKYVRFYKIVSFVALPIGYVVGLFRGLSSHGASVTFKWPEALLFAFISLIAIGLFSLAIVVYIRFFYGKKIKELDRLIAEMDE